MNLEPDSHNHSRAAAEPKLPLVGALTVGLIEDESSVRAVLCRYLVAAGMKPAPFTRSHQVLEQIAVNRLDMLLVDIGLDDENGIDLIRQVRLISTLPIIIISGYCNSATVAEGLNAGADDYQRKPIAFDELAARISSVLRRHESSKPVENAIKGYRVGHVDIDFRTRSARSDLGKSDFTELEMQILTRLLQTPGKTLCRNALSRELFGKSWDPGTRALDVHMTRIRKKLSIAGAPDKLIMTQRNKGYALHPIVEIVRKS